MKSAVGAWRRGLETGLPQSDQVVVSCSSCPSTGLTIQVCQTCVLARIFSQISAILKNRIASRVMS